MADGTRGPWPSVGDHRLVLRLEGATNRCPLSRSRRPPEVRVHSSTDAHVCESKRDQREKPDAGFTHLAADIVDAATPPMLVDQAIARFGRLDVLVNNAGTGLVAFNARLKAHPAAPEPPIHCRVRQDRVSAEGKVTLRYMNRLLHIGVGRAFKHQSIRLTVADRHVRILTEDGVLIRELTLDPTRNYQAQQPEQIGHYHLRQTGTMT